MDKLRRLLRLPLGEKRLLVEAVVLVGVGAAALKVVPLRRLGPLIGRRGASAQAEPGEEGQRASRRVRRAIMRAAGNVPWEATCLAQAIAAKAMLRARDVPSTLYFGVAKNDGAVRAHAWVRVGETVITGEREMNDYEVILTFA